MNNTRKAVAKNINIEALINVLKSINTTYCNIEITQFTDQATKLLLIPINEPIQRDEENYKNNKELSNSRKNSSNENEDNEFDDNDSDSSINDIKDLLNLI